MPKRGATAVLTSKYAVWKRNAYPRDGFHTYYGPGEREIVKYCDSLEDANAIVVQTFYKKNPWRITRVDFEDKEVEARMKNGMLYMVVSPPDSEVWEVCTSLASSMIKKPKRKRDLFAEESSSEEEWPETLYGKNIRNVPAYPNSDVTEDDAVVELSGDSEDSGVVYESEGDFETETGSEDTGSGTEEFSEDEGSAASGRGYSDFEEAAPY